MPRPIILTPTTWTVLSLLTSLGLAHARTPAATPAADPALAARVTAVAARAHGQVSVAITHIESGRGTAVDGEARQPLFSVVKLPVAIVLLREQAAGRAGFALDRTLRVEAADVLPGAPGAAERWRDVPKQLTIRALLELSLGVSDNTASDKLMTLVGGPSEVLRHLRALGVDDLTIRSTYHDDLPNLGGAGATNCLLVRLAKGELLAPAERELVLGFLSHGASGARRLPARLPPGTPVAHKTGTGRDGAGTNDVGIITLPSGKDHVAVSVLIAGSPLPTEAQEDLIAEIGRLAYDAFTTKP
jgi:beta-lactamase class A